MSLYKRTRRAAARRAPFAPVAESSGPTALRRISIERLESRLLLSDTPMTWLNRTADSNPANYVEINGEMYFTTAPPSGPHQLWKSDGTAAGTTAVASSGSDPYVNTWFLGLTASGGKLYYIAPSGQGNSEGLFVTDGTVAGTKLLEEGTFNFENDPLLTDVNGTLYFVDLQGVTENIFRTDGTAAGTVQVTNWPSNSGFEVTTPLTQVGNSLYFGGWNSSGIQLWSYDLGSGATQLVNDVAPIQLTPMDLVNVNGTLFFSGFDATHGRELWKSDGTAAGTVLIDDINPGARDSSPANIIAVDGRAYFFAQSSNNAAYQLWTSDGTAAGTHLVSAASFTPTGLNPLQTLSLNGKVYFTADDGAHGVQVWSADNAGDVTMLSPPAGGYTNPGNLGSVGNELLFTASDPAHGNELWESDGTAAGTRLLKDINPGDGGSYIAMTTTFGQEAIFTAYDGKHGLEPWVTDGNTAGTMLLQDINSSPVNANPQQLIAFGDKLLFTTAESISSTPYRDGTESLDLWATDGTEAGTTKLTALTGIQKGTPQSPEWVVYNGDLYFAGAGGLWKTDGTPAGTSRVMSFAAWNGEPPPGSISSLAVCNGRLYFNGTDPNGTGLWTSDGTAYGTHLIEDLSAPTNGTGPQDIVPVGSALYFTVNNGAGPLLYRSDGTTAGTVKVTSPDFVFPASYLWNNVSATVGGTSLFVAGLSGQTTMSLWRTIGSTYQYATVLPSAKLSVLSGITLLNGAAYFLARDSSGNLSLWKSDGTDAGTVVVAQVAPASDTGSIPGDLKNVNGTLYFTDPNGALWESDGTSTGTTIVHPTEADNPIYLVLNGQPWSTAGSIVPLDDGPSHEAAVVDDQIFYTTFNLQTGYHLYAGTPLTETPPAAPSSLRAMPAPGAAIALQWSSPSNQAAFVIDRSTDPDFSTIDASFTLGDSQATSYVDHTAAIGVKYYYKISSYNRAGSSGYSQVASAVAQAAMASAAVNVNGAELALQTAPDGLRLLPAGRLNDLPWSGLQQFQITLDVPAILQSSDVSAMGSNGVSYGPVTITGSGNTYTLTLAHPVTTAERLLLTIGNAQIAEFTREIDILPGDVNDNGQVDFADFVSLSSHFGYGRVPRLPVTGDLNADGIINFADFVILSEDFGKSLPAVQTPAIRRLAAVSRTPITTRASVRPGVRQTGRARLKGTTGRKAAVAIRIGDSQSDFCVHGARLLLYID